MLTTIVIVVHVLVSLALIMTILLQTSKGAGMGAAFGGASQTVFGSTGRATFLSKLTVVAAVVFGVTSIGLSFMQSGSTSIFDKLPAAPAAPTAPSLPGAPILPGAPPGALPAPDGAATAPSPGPAPAVVPPSLPAPAGAAPSPVPTPPTAAPASPAPAEAPTGAPPGGP